MSHPLRPGLTLALLFLAAAAAGWRTSGKRTVPPSPAGALPGKFATREPGTAGKTAMPDDARALMAPVLAATTPVERLRATIRLAHHLPVGSFEPWLAAGWFDVQDTLAAEVFERILRSRWIAGSPAECLDFFTKRGGDAGDEALWWAKRDPRGLAGYLVDRKNPDHLKLVGALSWGTDPAIDRGFGTEIALAWIDAVGASGWTAKLAHQSPDMKTREAATVMARIIARMVEHSPDLVSDRSAGWPPVMKRVVDEELFPASFRRDFAGGIATLMNDPDGKQRFLATVQGDKELLDRMMEQRDGIPAGWFKEAFEQNVERIAGGEAGKWLDADLTAMGFSAGQAKNLVARLERGYSLGSPEAALEKVIAGGLTDSRRKTFLSQGMHTLAEKDLAAATAWLDRFTDQADRELAESVIAARKRDLNPKLHPDPPWKVELPPAPPKAPTPADWLAELPPPESRGNIPWAKLLAVGGWEGDPVIRAREAFQQLEAGDKDAVAIALANKIQENTIFELQGDAIAHLIGTLPPDLESRHDFKQVIENACFFADQWATQDPVAAGRWIQSLPEGAARLWASKNLAARWAEHEPAAALRWVAGLTPGERQEVKDYLKSGRAWK